MCSNTIKSQADFKEPPVNFLSIQVHFFLYLLMVLKLTCDSLGILSLIFTRTFKAQMSPQNASGMVVLALALEEKWKTTGFIQEVFDKRVRAKSGKASKGKRGSQMW